MDGVEYNTVHIFIQETAQQNVDGELMNNSRGIYALAINNFN